MSENEAVVANAVEPQAPWNPPTGDIDFDAMFGGAGDGSSDIVQVEEAVSTPVDQTTEATEESTEGQETAPVTSVKQTTLKTDPETGFLVGTYKTKEEAERGLNEKDQLIARMRSMLEAATGVDPVKVIKGRGDRTNVSYLQDATQYAMDKTKAAELGQKTGDWTAYRDVEAKLQREIMQQDLAPYMPVVQDVGRQKAIKAVASEIPDFETFYGSETWNKALEARPKLREAVEMGEQRGIPPLDMAELYKSVYDAGQTIKLPTLLKQNSTTSNSSQNPAARMPMSNSRLAPPQPNPNGVQPGLNTSAGRKALIAEMERKGIKDRNF